MTMGSDEVHFVMEAVLINETVYQASGIMPVINMKL